MTLLNARPPSGAQYVLYRGFTSMNAVDAAEDILRSELALGVNTWSNGSASVFKRPGSTAAITANGQIPGGGTGYDVLDMISARFNGVTYLVALVTGAGGTPTLYQAPIGSAGPWSLIGTMSAGASQIFGAQMFDPDTGFDTLFITNGVDIPQMWSIGGGYHPVTTGTVGGTDVITSNPALAGGGNLIAAVVATGAAITTTFTVTVTDAGHATIVDALTNSIVVASAGSGVLDMVTVTIGTLGAGDIGKVGTITITAAHDALPKNATASAYITPKYVATLGNNSHLFYSGEPTAKTAAYISDPTFPERFNNVAMQVNPYNGRYLPALIGFNDGINGGDITGMLSLQGGMVVWKQSAIYVMVLTTLLGEVPVWQVFQVSSIGTSAPKSIVAFEINGQFFAAYQAVDGVYTTSGLPGSGSQKISGSVNRLFDATYSGTTVPIGASQALAVRCGNRYMLNHLGGSNAAKFCWFDFDTIDRRGNPSFGTVQGFNPIAMVSLRGPADVGNFAWADSATSYVGIFGSGYLDGGLLAQPGVALSVTGKDDIFDTEFGQIAFGKRKQVEKMWVYFQIPAAAGAQNFYFDVYVVCDGSANTANAVLASVNGPQGPFSAAPGKQATFGIPVPLQATSITGAASRGRSIQVTISENVAAEGMAVPGLVLLGYALQLGEQLVDV